MANEPTGVSLIGEKSVPSISHDAEQKRSERKKRQVENANKVFLDMHFSCNFEQQVEGKYEEQMQLLEDTTGRSVSDTIEDLRASDNPSYKNISEIGVPCVCTCCCAGLFNTLRPCLPCEFDKEPSKQRKNQICLGLKFDLFSLMVLIALIQQGQNNASDFISVLSYSFTLTCEFLVCLICLSERFPLIGKLFPEFILSTKPKTDVELNASVKLPPPFSPFAPPLWEYSVPFLVYFEKTFAPETRVFYHKIPTAFSPVLLFTRSACNILIIISTIILRFQAMSYNAKMFNLPEPTWNLPFNPNPPMNQVATEAAVCEAVARPQIFYPVNQIIQDNFEMIHTPMLLNFFIVFYMALSVKSFSLTRKSIETLENVGHELKRHKLMYHNGGASESSFSLWLAINDIWVEDMVENTDFLSQMMGFQDVVLNHSSGKLEPKTEKSAAAKRLLILSLIPLLLALIVPVTYALVKDPVTAERLGIPCLDSCLNRFSASVMGRCDTARNTTVWNGNSYYHGCVRCAILVHGSFGKTAYYIIQIFTSIATFFETHVAVHCIGLMMTVPFFMMTKRMESLLRTIDRTSCIQSMHYAPLIPLCNGQQISAWLALFRFEKTAMKLKFSESSLPLGVLLVAILILGATTLAFAVTRANALVISAFAAYFVMTSTFFLTNFALAAVITSKQDDAKLRVREQQVNFMFHSSELTTDDNSEAQIPKDSNIHEQLDSMIGYLETNSDTLKLLRIVPANFTILTLIGGYAGTALVSMATYVAATFPSK